MNCNSYKKESSESNYISWKEHTIDDYELSGNKISGGDGLVMADIDMDGFEDIISVHESDWKYDGIPRGHLRIAFGSNDPDIFYLTTIGEGQEVGGIEDVAVVDLNKDGFLDIIAACELSHITYFENPGKNIRTHYWKRLIPEITKNRGSFIRVFTADLNKDGQSEIITANKGSQAGYAKGATPKPISYFEIIGNPLNNSSWKETVLLNVLVPINAQPIDIDNDGDLDILVGSRGENRIVLMENISQDSIQFQAHNINISKIANLNLPNVEVSGFNLDFYDINKDTLLDIIIKDNQENLIWLEQPPIFSKEWIPHNIGSISPDILVGFVTADINGNQLMDIIVGSYSKGARTKDGNVTVNDHLGSLAWFEQPTNLSKKWIFHPIVRRKRGMYDKFIAYDMDKDGDLDFVYTRGNSHPFDGVYWIEQIRSKENPTVFFKSERIKDSEKMPFINQ
ncbi:FG-GAP repeat domain-containing protein [Flavivirga aquatica]|uniref:FG-GAP repeat domain-containing protein n=1 Tax=Flavivirga aquatica TaxID=1849968 RepID=UPI0013F4DFFD|nr:VCBS repeat-containing protein [Flavivirga aquatica]